MFENSQLQMSSQYASHLNAVDSESPGFIANVGYGVASAGISGALGIWNTGVSLLNSFGVDAEQVDTAGAISSILGQDAVTNYYNNKDLIDGAGFIATSIIPGAAGVKLVNALRAGKLYEGVKIGYGLENGFAAKYALQAERLAKYEDNVGDAIHLAKIRAGFGATADALVENAIASTAILATSNQNPFINKDDLGYFESFGQNWGEFVNPLGNGLGISIFAADAAFRTVGTLGKIAKAVGAAELARAPNIRYNDFGAVNIDNGSRYLNFRKQLDEVDTQLESYKNAGQQTPEIATAVRDLEKKKSALTLESEKSIAGMFASQDPVMVKLAQEAFAGKDTAGIAQQLPGIMRLERAKPKLGPQDSPTTGIYNIGTDLTIDEFGTFTPSLNEINMQTPQSMSAMLTEQTGQIFSDDDVMKTWLSTFLHEEGHARTIAPVSGELQLRPEVDTALFKSLAGTTNAGMTFTVSAIEEISKAGAISGKQASRLKELAASMEELSRASRPDAWNKYDIVADRLKLHDAGKITLNDVQLKEYRAHIDEISSLPELLADAYRSLDNPEFGMTALAAKHTKLTKALKDSNVLAERFGPKKMVFDSYKAGKTGEWSAIKVIPQVSDLGSMKLTRDGKSILYANDSKTVSLDTPISAETSIHDADAIWAGWELRYREGKNLPPLDVNNKPQMQAAINLAKRNGELEIALPDGTTRSVANMEADLLDWKDASRSNIAMRNGTDETGKLSAQAVARLLNTSEEFAAFGKVDPNFEHNLYGTRDPLAPRHLIATADRRYQFDDNAIRGMVNFYEESKKVARQAGGTGAQFLNQYDNVWMKFYESKFKGNWDEVTTDVTTQSSKRGIFGATNADYGTMGAVAQAVGRALNGTLKRIDSGMREAGAAATELLRTSPEAMMEYNVIASKYGRSKTYYRSADRTTDETAREIARVSQYKGHDNMMISKDLYDEVTKLRNRQAGMDIKNPSKMTEQEYSDAIAELLKKNEDGGIIQIKNKATADALKWMQDLNKEVMSPRMQLTKAAGRPFQVDMNTIYFPPPASDQFTHVAIVRGKTPDANNLMAEPAHGMIVGTSAAHLEEQIKTISANLPDLQVFRKTDIAEYKKAKGEYDSERMIKTTSFDDTLRRSGAFVNPLPRSDSLEVSNFLDWAIEKQKANARDSVGLMFAKEISELTYMSNLTSSVNESTFGGLIRKVGLKADDAYKATIDTMLDRNNWTGSKTWQALSETLDSGYSALAHKLGQSIKLAKSDEDFEAMNKLMQDHGMTPAYKSAVELSTMNSVADNRMLTRAIGKGNAVVATLQLGIDTLQAITNVISLPVTLLPQMMNARKLATNPEYQKLFTVADPSSGIKIPSNTRAIANAIGDLVKGRNTANWKFYEDLGIIGRDLDYSQQALEKVQLPPGAFTDEKGWLGKYEDGTLQAVELAKRVSGTKLAEDSVRFVAAHVADQFYNILKKSEGSTLDRASFINSFVSKVHGNYTASQRPLFFQGVIGQAVSLFQTYQFNVIQQTMKNWGDGNKASVAAMVAMQGTIFGLRGVPGFTLLNQHIVGENSPTQDDVISRIYRGTDGMADPVLERRAADWLVYGVASNALHMDVFNRGDLNPRNALVIPTSFSELPLVNFASRFVNNIGNFANSVNAGGMNGNVLLEAIAHNALSRPLAGLATNALDYRTTGAGNKLLMDKSDMGWWADAAAIMGGKHIDEGIVLDTFYRKLGYDANQAKKLESLGSGLRAAIRNGSENVDHTKVLQKYTESGGRMENYNRWFTSVSNESTNSQMAKMVEKQRLPGNQHAMEIIGTDRGVQFHQAPPEAYFTEMGVAQTQEGAAGVAMQ